MNALLLLLLDSRSPAGGHNHSAGMEAAIQAGWVHDTADVEAFCRTRLRTTGRVNAAFAAAACRLAQSGAGDLVAPATSGGFRGNKITAGGPGAGDLVAPATSGGPDGNKIAGGPGDAGAWDELDAEFDARTPSAAMRTASRQLGRGLMRLVRASLPAFDAPWRTTTPHHPLVLGAAVAAAGGDAELAARAAALATVSVPTSGAVRLLGLDPFAAHAVLARLAPDVDALARDLAHDLAHDTALSAAGAPAFDLLADFHLTAEVRLFAS